MIVVKSFDDTSKYEDVLPHAVFYAPHHADHISAEVLKCLYGKTYPGVNIEELRKVIQQGDTHADMTMVKARLSSIYGEFHNKENSPEA